jgi:hypothetical protein
LIYLQLPICIRFLAKLKRMVIPPPGLGFGDIYNTLLGIYHFIQRYRNAGQTIIAVGRDCQSLEQELRDLEWKADSRNFDDVHGLKAKEWYA